MGEKKPGVVYKRKYRKVEDRIQPIATQLLEEFRIVRNIIGDPLENMPILPTHPPDFVPSDNLYTTQTPECSKGKYNAKIRKQKSLLRSHQQPM
jgi:hypothetical protein